MKSPRVTTLLEILSSSLKGCPTELPALSIAASGFFGCSDLELSSGSTYSTSDDVASGKGRYRLKNSTSKSFRNSAGLVIVMLKLDAAQTMADVTWPKAPE